MSFLEKGVSRSLQCVARSAGDASCKTSLTSRTRRGMATATKIPVAQIEAAVPLFAASKISSPTSLSAQDVLATVYSFPRFEPLRFEYYPSSHLSVPLRRDLLHRAVIYEGDMARQGTASTKWRSEVHGSGRKIRPQKGTGSARLGDKKSPMLRGGGVAFGPKPRDFSTDLPRKIYDKAWRTALSYRYRKGELVIIEDGAELEMSHPRYLSQVFERNGWGNKDGRSLIVTTSERENLFQALEDAGDQGRALTSDRVKVKSLLELGRVIIEKSAFDDILLKHQSDILRRLSPGRP